MGIFDILFIQPITNILIALYKALLFFNVPYALGFSIILLTVIIRVILYPFVSAQIKAAHKMQKVSPHLARIREQHKNDKKRQQEELMKLYKEHGVNPAAGCLPMIIQFPIIIGLYNVLTRVVGAGSIEAIGKINELLYFPPLRLENVWDTSFFGISLASNPSKVISSQPLVLLVPLLTVVFQFILSKMMIPEKNKEPEKKALPAGRQALPPHRKDDFQSAFQTQSLYIFPIMIGVFSYTLPTGLSIYWNTFTVFGILQQYLLVGSGGLSPWIRKISGKTDEREKERK